MNKSNNKELVQDKDVNIIFFDFSIDYKNKACDKSSKTPQDYQRGRYLKKKPN